MSWVSTDSLTSFSLTEVLSYSLRHYTIKNALSIWEYCTIFLIQNYKQVRAEDSDLNCKQSIRQALKKIINTKPQQFIDLSGQRNKDA